MPRYRITYPFLDVLEGDADSIRKAIRDLSFSIAFQPDDINKWEVTRSESSNRFELRAWRRIEEEVTGDSQREALRKFLYSPQLPREVDYKEIIIETLPSSDLKEIAA